MSANPPEEAKTKCPPPRFTPTEEKILGVLSDGEPHNLDEILSRVDTFDEFTDRETVCKHLNRIREKLRPLNHGILVQFIQRKIHYRHVTFIDPSVYGNLLLSR